LVCEKNFFINEVIFPFGFVILSVGERGFLSSIFSGDGFFDERGKLTECLIVYR